jgi:hypothetical protein
MTALLHALELTVRGAAVCAVMVVAYLLVIWMFADDKETK